MAECLVCVPHAEIPDDEIIDHLRLFHPEQYDATPAETEELIVRGADFAHGLRCVRCCRLLKDGDRYAEELAGIISGLPLVGLICIPCDEAIGEDGHV